MKLPLLLTLPLALSVVRASSLPPEAYPGLRDENGQLIAPVRDYLGKDVRIVDRKTDPELLKRRNNFGYTPEEIERYFCSPAPMILDETGLDRSLIKPPPPPGVHPRVIFNPEDVPLIRERLTDTEAGRSAIGAIRSELEKTITGPNAKFGAEYEILVKGELPAKVENPLAYALMYEAFRCLIDDDQEGGKRVAAAITTFAGLVDQELDAAIAAAKPGDLALNDPTQTPPIIDARTVSQGPMREFSLGLDYDFAYNFMTPAKRDTVRKVIAKGTANLNGIGCETLPAFHAGLSNWISWGCRALFAICAIEGEEGYDPVSFQRFAHAQMNFIASLYPSGEAFEGWGKNFAFLEHLVILAKRGQQYNVLGHTGLRSAYNNFFIGAMSPWGNSFTFYDSLARSGGKIARNADVLMYRALFPDDIAGQFVYRNQIGGDYANVGQNSINLRHPFATMDALCCAIFAIDTAPVTPEEEHARVTNGRPLTVFSEDTGNVMTRSDWSPDAVYLSYLNRSIPGGHQYCDRSHFNLYADGRFWSIYQGSRQVGPQYMPVMRSVVLAGDAGPSTAEAECVEFRDGPYATFVTTNLANPWNYQTSGLVKPPGGTELQQKTWNYNAFRLRPSPVAWKDLPIGQLPNWYTSEKPKPGEAASWYRRYDVVSAFRTAGLVRGPHPYVLIVDDLQLDDVPRDYNWAMTMAPDVVLEAAQRTSAQPGASEAEVILSETDTPDLKNATPSDTRRKLLVRVLSADSLKETPAEVVSVNVPNPPQPDVVLNRLQIVSDSVKPGFKMLLYPHKEGEALPVTTWNADRTQLTIQWPDQTDVVTFTPEQSGRTYVEITRGGVPIMPRIAAAGS